MNNKNFYSTSLAVLILLFIGLMSASVTHAENYTFVAKWGSHGSEDGKFDAPWGVAVDSSGNVYVADENNHRIQKFSSDGTFVTKWGSYGTSNGFFKYPRGVTTDSLGNIYVADTDNNRIQKFDSSCTFMATWGSQGNGNGKFMGPKGVAIDSLGDIYVADSYNNFIQKLGRNGNYLTQWGSLGSENGQLNHPYGVAVDSSNNVYVADFGNHRIQKFDSYGNFIISWGSYGSEEGKFNNPAGVAVDSSGNVYVVDAGNYRIQKFDGDGTFITCWGSQGTGDGQFIGPRGVAVDSSGNVYVADWDNNHCIQKFALKEKITPTITWNNPANITAGTVLGSEQLNAIATNPNTGNPVTGTFTYNPKEGTVLDIGMGQTLHVDFTPSDSATYNNTSANVQINVLPVPLKNPTIIWDNPANITVGTALSRTQLNAVAKDPVTGAIIEGAYVYDPAAGTQLPVGNGQKLHVNFVPADTAAYNTTSADVTINVLEKPVTPVANFSASPLKGKAPLIVTFKDESTGSPKSWEWNFGDKSISTDQYPSHTYSKAGKYTVSLKVENAVGNNTKTISKYIIVEKNSKKK